ncbi:MAG: hypothetical protein EXR72_19595 [Myxococcales bacterium]|nr:hypothetical protein [Myxococcales bacterium]
MAGLSAPPRRRRRLDPHRYDPHWIGGSLLHDQIGALPIEILLARLGVGPLHALNAATFLLQLAYGFLALRIAGDFAALVRSDGDHDDAPWSTAERIGAAGVFCFLPVLAWRLTFGHLLLGFGALALPLLVALLLAAFRGRQSLTLLAVALVTLLHIFPHPGQQTTLYGLLFGAPLVLGLFASLVPGRTARVLLRLSPAVLLLVAAALLFSLPQLAALLHHFTSEDSARDLGTPDIVYSFTVGHLHDWIGSIPWSFRLPPLRPAPYFHEVNYPVGPLVLALFLLPRSRFRPLLIGGALSFALAIAFSSQVPLVSTALLAALPPLRAFRVPARSLLPLLLLATPLAIALLRARWPGPPTRREIALAAATAGLLLCSGLEREAAIWLFTAAAVVRVNPLRARLHPAIVYCALGFAAIAASGERLVPFLDGEVLARAGGLQRIVATSGPRAIAPLERVAIGAPQLDGFAENTAWAARLAALQGYGLPGPRLLRLHAAVRGAPYDPGRTVLEITSDDADFPLWSRLYAIGTRVDAGPAPRAEPIAGAGPPARFVRRFVTVPSFARLADALRADHDGSLGHLMEGDPQPPASSSVASDAPACLGARAEITTFGTGPIILQGRTRSPARCALVLALHYVHDMRIDGFAADGSRRALPIFPVEGALTGTLVPPEVTAIELRLEPSAPPWTHALAWAGWLLVALAAVRVLRG